MKKRFLIGGHLRIEYDVFISLLKSFLTPEKVKDRFASDIEKTIKYKDENIEIYINEDDDECFLFDAEYLGADSEVQSFMNELEAKLIENKISYYQFQWSEYDDDDNEVGKELEIKFPSENQPLT